MNDSDVRKSLNAAALDFLTVVTEINTSSGAVTGLPIIPAKSIAWENRKFQPPVGSLWAAVFYVPNIPESRTIGLGGIDEITGFIQIDFNVGLDTGDSEFVNWEDKARLYFTSGISFDHGSHSTLVLSSGLGQGRRDGSDYTKSLTVAFKSQLNRNILTP